MTYKTFKKAAMFTDIHFGRKNNSDLHNRDCVRFIEWFCQRVKEDPEIDCVFFLGDWHEHRSAINGSTLTYSYSGAKLLSELGIPVFWVIGNHDLYNRNNRNIFTTNPFESLPNFTLVNEAPLVLEKNDTVIFPYLFEAEYHSLLPTYAAKHSVVMGHFEFKGFVVTGESKVMEHGPEHTNFSGPKRIFSGHFHKRQVKDNVAYIGNAFPGDFGDANDFERGMATYVWETDKLEFFDWAECPKYVSALLSQIMEDPKGVLIPDSRVKCEVDIDLTYEESTTLKEKFTKKYKLREFTMQEANDHAELLENTDFDLTGFETESTTNIVKEMLRQVKGDKIDPVKLVQIYEESKRAV